MLLKLRNWSLGGCLLILSNFFTQANCCEDNATSPYLLATGSAGKERLDRIEECYAHFNQSLLESFPSLPEDAKILSVGCGTGTRECQMARLWPHAYITAVDNSEDKLVLARARAFNLGLTNIDFVLGDASSLPFINCFHVVYARFLLVHMRNPGSIVEAMYVLQNLGV